MSRWASRWAAILLLASLPGPALAQLALPDAGRALDGIGDRLDGALDAADRPLAGALAAVAENARVLADARLDRLAGFVRRNRAVVERDEQGQPARAHELLLLDPDPAALDLARAAGFTPIEQGSLDGLGIGYARLGTPTGKSLPLAQAILRQLLPGRTITADHIHFASGAPAGSRRAPSPAVAPPLPRGGTVGVIDGGARDGPRIVRMAGFAAGAPRAAEHAQAIVSLLAGAGTARIVVADVYGSDPAGGNALAIARALAWMAQARVPVVSISLVGPANPLLARAVAAAQARGMTVVAAVGNDGPAAPPAYPASYERVIAVTGVDGRNRPLLEAGTARHLDFAAPGADLTAIGLDGLARQRRGTSFAAPLVAARMAARAANVADVVREAVAAGPRTGRGVLCRDCRTGL